MATPWSMAAAPPRMTGPTAAAGRPVRFGIPPATSACSAPSRRSRRARRGRRRSTAGCAWTVAVPTPSGSLRVPREFQEWKARLTDCDQVGPDSLRWCKAGRPGSGDEIILLDAVSAHPEPTHQLTVEVERHAARKKDDSTLMIRVWRLTSLPARRRDVLQEEREEWALHHRFGWRRLILTRRVERLSTEADRAVRHCRTRRNEG